MSNVLQFPTKTQPIEVASSGDLKKNVHRGFFKDADHRSDSFFLEGIQFIRNHDFRGSFDSYPEIPVKGFITKVEVHNTIVRTSDIAVAAVLAIDLVRDAEAGAELRDLYLKLLSNKHISLTLGYLPPHLIGFVMFLGESLSTTSYGQHPANPIFMQYGWHLSCIRLLEFPVKTK